MKTLKQTIAEHSFFVGIKPEHLDVIMAGASEIELKSDQILIYEGQPASQFFLIESGRVIIEARQPGNGTTLVQTLDAGDVLGWSWLFPPFIWHFQARALEPTRAIVLNAAHLLVSAEKNHEFGYELMKRVAQVVIRRLQATRKLLLDLAQPGHVAENDAYHI